MTQQPPAALVTGAASGMGASVAARFVAEGWRVVALDVDPAGLARLAESLGERLVPARVDIRDRAAVAAALDPDADLDAVVNFASIDAFAVSRGQLMYRASKAAVVARPS